ncbi:hypothetical protein NKH80_25445 [Mesorhizobium sp. M0904]|uniref:NACHT domain-containing protein n=1 Tax=unclassified Mesorhizobium TaxID=325217 RepID=UPI00333C3B49
MPVYIPRSLSVEDRTFTEEALLREGRVFVVLAEPGAGKTELLDKLAELLQTTRVRASVFRNKPAATGNGPLVIDAMDEVARIDTLATDRIIALASENSISTIVFAGRSAEWDKSRTAYVEECFGVKPVIVRLEPFNEDEQRLLFNARFPGEDFGAFAQEARRFELEPLLGNPQFLQLLGDAYLESGRVFISKAKIFADAVRRLAHETNVQQPRQKDKPPTDEIVALGEEVFAKLMLSGASGIATVEPLADRDYPYINSLCGEGASASYLIDTRLLKPSGDTDRHEPVHRIVAEYCAAGHLVKRIENPADRLSLDRVLAIVAPNGVIRDELRGMAGWMAAMGHEPLQLTVIKLDPYAVLANGDPSQLTPRSKKELLVALDALADRDPLFRRSDLWRRFNVGHFFTADILDRVKTILAKKSTLQALVLELLIGTEAATTLAPELSALVTNAGVDVDTRRLASEALLSVTTYDPTSDFTALLAEGSPASLEVAARTVTRRGVQPVGATFVSSLLEKLTALYPRPNVRDRDGISLYFIDLLIRSFELADVERFLDDLTTSLKCTCTPKHAYSCTCRHGKSKVAAKLLDRNFELSEGRTQDPAHIWSWLKALHFQGQVGSDSSVAVKHLSQDTELRRTMQRMDVDGVTGEDAAHEAVMRLYSSHVHSGLRMHEGDAEALSQHAFDIGNADLWGALLVGYDRWSKNKGPNPLRALQRQQSRTARAFLAARSLLERRRQNYNRIERRGLHVRNRKRWRQREEDVVGQNREHLRANIAAVEAGRNWFWLRQFAQKYLLEPDELNGLVDDPETPLKALRNCFPLLDAYIPTVEALGLRKRPDIAEVLLAACVVLYRDGKDLKEIDPRIVAAAKAEASSYPTFAEGEAEEFEAALDAALFTADGSAEAFVRAYIEPQLVAGENHPQRCYRLDQTRAFQNLRKTLPLEWLERFPQTSFEAASTLFNMASKHGDDSELIALIDKRLADPVIENKEDPEVEKRSRARHTFWQLNAFLYDTPGRAAAWDELRRDPKTIFALEHRLGRFNEDNDVDKAPVTAEMVFKIMDAYVGVWPKVHLPSSWGSDNPEEETAYRFLRDLIWKVAEDAPARRIEVLDRMIADPRFVDFRGAALTLRAEAGRKLALQDFRAPSPADINALLDRGDVASVEDLRALMVEQLGQLQQWLIGSETNPLDSFYDGGKRLDENTARNRIVDQLQSSMKALGLSVNIERYMAGGNRCDITASAVFGGANRLLVTEVKGQWNDELYTAASAQLDKRYAIHPDAAKQGVYLVLWYANGEKVAKVLDPTITTATELRTRILEKMSDDLKARIDVVVLDLSRPLAGPKPAKKATGKTAPHRKATPKSSSPRKRSVPKPAGDK